jgi:hypothetical protein
MDRRAWVRDTLATSDLVVPLPAGAVDELEAVVHRLRRDPLPTLLLSPAQFSLARCLDVMEAVGRQLRDGIGLAVLDRIPVERFSADENRPSGGFSDRSWDASWRRSGTARCSTTSATPARR